MYPIYILEVPPIPAKTSLCDLHPIEFSGESRYASTKPTESSDSKNAGLLPEKLSS